MDNQDTIKEKLRGYDNQKFEWKFLGWGSIVALGEYIDAFAIVAFSAALVYVTPLYHIPAILVGLVPAIFGYTWITIALGGGHISDSIGWKTLYKWDPVIVIIGSFLMVLSPYLNYDLVLLMFGYGMVGVGVGLDIPASEALIAELSPRKHRRKMMTLASIWWYIGPMSALLIALFSPVNVVGFERLFIFLIEFAIFTYILRMLLVESPRYLLLRNQVHLFNKEIKRTHGVKEGINTKEDASGMYHKYKWKDLFMPSLVGFTIYIMLMNIFWAVRASTFSIYQPYIAKGIGGVGFRGAGERDMLWFLTSIVGLLLSWLYVDKPGTTFNRKNLFILSGVIVGIGFILFGVIPLTRPVLGLLSVAIIGFFQGFGMWPIIWIWGTERFPTAVRAAGPGFLSETDRYVNYSWTLALPAILIVLGLRNVAFVLASVAIIMAVASVLFAPKKKESESLEDIENLLSTWRGTKRTA
ncbi:MAG: MFS transporter, partial [Conexivisphaerales archaeon]